MGSFVKKKEKHMATTWKGGGTLDDALSLPLGRYCANFGFWVDQSVEPQHVQHAVDAINENVEHGAMTFVSQAQIIVKAQEENLAFADWAELNLF